MYDFDVVFLLLSSPSSPTFSAFLDLYSNTANVGFYATIATNPSELRARARRPRIIVIDGGDGNVDVDDVLARVGRLKNVRTVLMNNVDMSPSMTYDFDTFWKTLVSVAGDPAISA